MMHSCTPLGPHPYLPTAIPLLLQPNLSFASAVVTLRFLAASFPSVFLLVAAGQARGSGPSAVPGEPPSLLFLWQ